MLYAYMSNRVRAVFVEIGAYRMQICIEGVES